MSDGESENLDLVIVARGVRTRGLKGELVAELLTDFPERFETIDSFIALAPSGERKVVELEDFWFQSGRVILKLSGCDSVEAASEFTGYEFCVSDADRVPLADDEYYDFDLEALPGGGRLVPRARQPMLIEVGTGAQAAVVRVDEARYGAHEGRVDAVEQVEAAVGIRTASQHGE